MKNFDEHIDLIERYLYDDLTQEELEEFNGLLQKDSEFNKLFYEMDNLLEGIRRSAKQTTIEEKLTNLEKSLPYKLSIDESEGSVGWLRKLIHSTDKFIDELIIKLFNLDREEISVVPINSQGKTSILTLSGKIKLMAASSVVIIFLATYFIYIQFSEFNPSLAYAENYERPELEVVNVRSADPSDKSELSPVDIHNQAKLEFNQSNFGKAIDLLEGVPEGDKTPAMKYCEALSHMEKEEFEKATQLWVQLIDDTDILWQERAKWFLALCYIKADHQKQAINNLEEVSEIGGYYQERADRLLKQLDK